MTIAGKRVGIRVGNVAGIQLGAGNRLPSWDSYWTTLSSGAIKYKRETNILGGYFKLHYSSDSGATYEEILNLDITEDNPIIDLAHIYRHRIVGTSYRVDRTLTPTGYAGAENTDWENIYST